MLSPRWVSSPPAILPLPTYDTAGEQFRVMASPSDPKANAKRTDRYVVDRKTGTSQENRMPMNESFDHPEAETSALPARPEPIHGIGPDSERVRGYSDPDLKDRKSVV